MDGKWNQFLATAARSGSGPKLNWLTGPIAVVVVVLFAAIIVITFLQVVFRYVFNAPLHWSEEASTYLFIWIVFLGTALALGKRMHIGVDILVNLLPARVQLLVGVLTRLLILCFSVIVFVASLPLVQDNMSQISPALELPMTAVYIAIPLSMLAMAVISLAEIVAQLRKRKAPEA